MGDLNRRAISGLARFQIGLALIIFLPAWSVTYWEGLVYWLLFGAACLTITLYFLQRDPALVERRMRAGPGAESDPKQKTIMWLASLALIALYLVSALDYRFGWSNVPPAASVIADLLVALGFCGIFIAFHANAYAAATVKVERNQPVITAGPYALV